MNNPNPSFTISFRYFRLATVNAKPKAKNKNLYDIIDEIIYESKSEHAIASLLSQDHMFTSALIIYA